MTDVKLLPSSVAAFTEALKGERGSLDAWLEVHDEREVRAHVEAYTRANIGVATAVRDAEIEALRAEVEAWRELSDHVRVGACAAIWPDRYTDARTRDVAAALKRAARMEEALALLPDEIVMIEHNPYEGQLMFCCGQRVTLSWRHGLEPTHNKGCWYARMRAMRDHDQEDRND